MSASKYEAPAIQKTILKPNCTAITVAMTGPITEKQPLTPHAQGMWPGKVACNFFNPSGNGIPMMNPMGKSIIDVMRMLCRLPASVSACPRCMRRKL